MKVFLSYTRSDWSKTIGHERTSKISIIDKFRVYTSVIIIYTLLKETLCSLH